MSDVYTMVASSFVLWLSLFSLAAGVFTAYYGTGRSRTIGAVLVIVGVVFLFLVLWYTGMIPGLYRPFVWDRTLVLNTFLATLGALAGAVVAIGLFLLAIMRS